MSKEKDCCHKCGVWHNTENLVSGLCPFCRGTVEARIWQ